MAKLTRPFDKLEAKFRTDDESGVARISSGLKMSYHTVHSWGRRRGTIPFGYHDRIRKLGAELGVEVLDSDFLIG